MEGIVKLFWGVLCLIVFYIGFIYVENAKISGQELPQVGCGVVSNPHPMDDKASLGHILFKENCASCHNKNMKDDLTGPALGGVMERWAAFPKEDLYAWIRSSTNLINSGHPRAKVLFENWDKYVCNSFSTLSDKEIEALLSYIEYDYN